MCQAIEELNRKAAAKAAQETARKEREETAMTLLGFGLLSYERIAEASRLTVEEVKALDAQRTA